MTWVALLNPISLSAVAEAKEQWVTRHTLMKRASNPDDKKAWEDFVGYYKPFIKMVIHRISNPNAADADDLVQEVLIALWKNLSKYDSKKAKFRTWMSTIIRNTIYTHYQANKRRGERETKAADIQETDQENKATDIENYIEEEWKDYIIALAMERLKELFSESAIEVFTLSMQDMSVEEISKQVGIKTDSIYVLKSRVKKRFMDEIRLLTEEMQ